MPPDMHRAWPAYRVFDETGVHPPNSKMAGSGTCSSPAASAETSVAAAVVSGGTVVLDAPSVAGRDSSTGSVLRFAYPQVLLRRVHEVT